MGSSENSIRKKKKYHRFPNIEQLRGELTFLIDQDLTTHLNEAGKFISKNSSFFTMGSCFAENISQSLREKGYNSIHMPLSEAINTTFANKYFIDYLRNISQDSLFNKRIEDSLPTDWNRGRIISTIQKTDVFIITMGVATGFFDIESNQMIIPRPKEIQEILLSKRFVPKMTTVSENVENMLYVIDYIQSLNPSIKIILTVSPIPISTSFEVEPAILTDCVSKSTMRVAAYELTNKCSLRDVYYWPSFEVFRWVASINSNYWAEDDGNPGHVSSDKVKRVINSFINCFSIK
jgi:hypothetical protein